MGIASGRNVGRPASRALLQKAERIDASAVPSASLCDALNSARRRPACRACRVGCTPWPSPQVPSVHPAPKAQTHVENSKTAAPPRDTLLCDGSEGPLELELVDTLVSGLSEGGTLGGLLFPAASADTDAVDDVALLCLVPQSAGLVRARRAGGAVDDVQLAVLPASHALEESCEVGLLLGAEGSEVGLGTPADWRIAAGAQQRQRHQGEPISKCSFFRCTSCCCCYCSCPCSVTAAQHMLTFWRTAGGMTAGQLSTPVKSGAGAAAHVCTLQYSNSQGTDKGEGGISCSIRGGRGRRGANRARG